jgi:hypothetical protein
MWCGAKLRAGTVQLPQNYLQPLYRFLLINYLNNYIFNDKSD